MDISPDLRQWILDQTRQGLAPNSVLQTLMAHGWPVGQAADALQRVLQGDLAETESEKSVPGPTAVPDPLPHGAAYVLDGSDRPVPVLARLRHPRILVLGSVLSNEECDELVALARTRLGPSETFMMDEGVKREHESRTSEGMFFERGENELCQRIEARLARLCQWPVEHGEGLQVLRYGPGAEYVPHYDYFDPDKAGTRTVLEAGGQRVATLVIYLNTPARGGQTTFPDAGLDVAPIKGNAVFFSYDRPHPSTGTLHGGSPVLEGEKWVATKWLRLRPYV